MNNHSLFKLISILLSFGSAQELAKQKPALLAVLPLIVVEHIEYAVDAHYEVVEFLAELKYETVRRANFSYVLSIFKNMNQPKRFEYKYF